ncbi:SDR family oxidoreductase [Cyclobacterium jeungdonense]|uniref:SDR family oxidoreductase n=1 Tax=Cyclobacterium jeungdonense TaxID=708087 RepID=A0ABT8C436_9BACT|nr:SDR family oxidoreductase [Cyclobacterium jeungdonense]MDN3687260.1 SDR family oxidoreductase [Cyclobacterium jeungdonense]
MEKYRAYFYTKSHDYVVNRKATQNPIIASKKIIKNLEAGIPPGHFGSLEDVAYAALYLASDRFGDMTGIELNVDGGILAGSEARPE